MDQTHMFICFIVYFYLRLPKLVAPLATILFPFFNPFIDGIGFSQQEKSSPPEKDWVFLKNEKLMVGILKSHGGAIGYLGLTSEPTKNYLNHFDHGRLVQQSYYGDQDDSIWNKQPWRYNPIQGGDYHGHPSSIKLFELNDRSCRIRTIPRHWASGELLNECLMEQVVTLHENDVHMHYRFEYTGHLSHAAHHQETPAVFVDAAYSKLIFYDGDRSWQKQTPQERTPGWPNEYIKLTEPWVAYVDDQKFGIGIYVPGVEDATCYRYQAAGDSACSYVAPLKTFALKPNLVFEYDAFMTLGKLDDIREHFHQLHQNAAVQK